MKFPFNLQHDNKVFAFDRQQAAEVVLQGVKAIEEGGKKEVKFLFVLVFLHAISQSFPQVIGLRAGQRGCWVGLQVPPIFPSIPSEEPPIT